MCVYNKRLLSYMDHSKHQATLYVSRTSVKNSNVSSHRVLVDHARRWVDDEIGLLSAQRTAVALRRANHLRQALAVQEVTARQPGDVLCHGLQAHRAFFVAAGAVFHDVIARPMFRGRPVCDT